MELMVLRAGLQGPSIGPMRDLHDELGRDGAAGYRLAAGVAVHGSVQDLGWGD